ncbi:MAG: OmpA family protein [Kordiimonadaceae bacterium]|jgi:peptidoglycan-associated lipoprotein|nr:OmpA family protein [Kordiimonadaceae bacterium]MBT6031124.1 OmpA family protein [Kordiimonadaceae bacterium]
MLKNKFYAKFLIMIGAALILSACANKKEEVMDNTPAPVAERPAPAPAPAPVVSRIDPLSQEALDSVMGGMAGSMVYFAYDRYDVDASARAILQAQAEWMKGNNVNVIVEGHCDERGTREYNLALGDRRANAAKNYLVAMGVPASRVRAVSFGKERPVDMSDHAKNRRGYTRVN